MGNFLQRLFKPRKEPGNIDRVEVMSGGPAYFSPFSGDAYESDILYSFSTPAYYNKGSRFYIMFKYDVNRSLDIWLRYSQSFYSNKNSIGTGLEEIKGNTKSELKLQLMVKF